MATRRRSSASATNVAVRFVSTILAALMFMSAGAAVAAPDDPSPTPTAPSGTSPVVPVPPGCEAPPLPHVVFVGTVVDRDFRTVRFEIDAVRAGDPAPFASDQLVDVRYGRDVQYLDDGETYIVGAPVHPVLGVLVSQVSDPIEDFGGDEVIGVSETDIRCPDFEDPMRTLNLDGTKVPAGVLAPLGEAEGRLLAAIVIPLGVAVAAIFVLALLRLSLAGLWQALRRERR